MYQTILLPLDASPIAEQALPHAIALAQAFEAILEVVCIVPVADTEAVARGAALAALETEMARNEEYLAGLAKSLNSDGLTCHTQVRCGEVTEEILRSSAEVEADIIVMSTHGRSGLGRWVYGSVADHVLRRAEVPVLLVRVVG
jgi:nucleotide-binding universal stress UspA family protein